VLQRLGPAHQERLSDFEPFPRPLRPHRRILEPYPGRQAGVILRQNGRGEAFVRGTIARLSQDFVCSHEPRHGSVHSRRSGTVRSAAERVHEGRSSPRSGRPFAAALSLAVQRQFGAVFGRGHASVVQPPLRTRKRRPFYGVVVRGGMRALDQDRPIWAKVCTPIDGALRSPFGRRLSPARRIPP
jgi:hypothetical protein